MSFCINWLYRIVYLESESSVVAKQVDKSRARYLEIFQERWSILIITISLWIILSIKFDSFFLHLNYSRFHQAFYLFTLINFQTAKRIMFIPYFIYIYNLNSGFSYLFKRDSQLKHFI